MGKYIIKRLIQMLLALVIVSFGVFMIINLIPGTPGRGIGWHQCLRGAASGFKCKIWVR